MNDTPGWASPGSAPSDRPGPTDGREPEAPGNRQEPADRQPKVSGSDPQQSGPADAAAPAGPAGRPADASGQESDPAQEPAPAPGTAASGTDVVGTDAVGTDAAPVPASAPGPEGPGQQDQAQSTDAGAGTGTGAGAGTGSGTAPAQKDPLAKWSKEQPPADTWSTPGGAAPGQAPPPPPPGPGWGGPGRGGYGPGPGGYGGYGPGPGWGGWQGRPPAAKPGVIPLRPLGVGEILDGTVTTMRTYWRTVLGIALSVAVVTQLVLVLLQGLVLDDAVADTAALDDRTATLGEVAHALRDALIGSGVVLVITLLGTIIATALLTTVTSRAVLGRPVTISEAWRDARPQVPRLIGLTLLLPLIFVAVVVVAMVPGILLTVAGAGDGGAALMVLGALAGAVVALWLTIRFTLASPALMLEKQSVRKALGRSAKLVKGSWWRIFGIQLLAGLIANIVSSIIVIPFALIAGAVDGDGVGGLLGTTGSHGWTYLVISGLGSVIGSMLTFPITAGVAVLLYIDQRIRREALDLELARVAGVQGYGPAAAPGHVPGG